MLDTGCSLHVLHVLRVNLQLAPATGRCTLVTVPAASASCLMTLPRSLPVVGGRRHLCGGRRGGGALPCQVLFHVQKAGLSSPLHHPEQRFDARELLQLLGNEPL